MWVVDKKTEIMIDYNNNYLIVNLMSVFLSTTHIGGTL